MRTKQTPIWEVVADELLSMAKEVSSDSTIPVQDRYKRLEELSQQKLINYEMQEVMQEVRKLLSDLYCYFGNIYSKKDAPKWLLDAIQHSLLSFVSQAKEPYHKLSCILDRASHLSKDRILHIAIVTLICKWKDEDTSSKSIQDIAMKQCMRMLLASNKHYLIEIGYGHLFNSSLEEGAS